MAFKGLLMLPCREKIGEWPEGKEAPGRPGGQRSGREMEGGICSGLGSSECGGWLGVWAGEYSGMTPRFQLQDDSDD